TGDLPMRTELRRNFPAGLLDLRNVAGLGPKRIRILADQLHVRNRDDLKRAAEAGQVRTIRGFGPKIEDQIIKPLSVTIEMADDRMQYVEAAVVARDLIAHLRSRSAIDRIEIAGSFRRRRETVGDLDLLVAAEDAASVIECFLQSPGVTSKLGAGDT